jgi:phage repressor protein C with HTH and peptisase S24 domain
LSAEAEPDGYVAVAVQAEADARYDADDAAEPMLFARAWLRALSTAPDEALRLVVHRGNSNEPVIRDGDLLLVDTTVKRIADDGLYVFPRDGKYLARFVERLFGGRVALKARNPDYGAQPLSQEEAERLPLLGRVLWRGGSL